MEPVTDLSDLKEEPQKYFDRCEQLLELRISDAHSKSLSIGVPVESLIKDVLTNQAIMMETQRFMISQMTLKPPYNPEY